LDCGRGTNECREAFRFAFTYRFAIPRKAAKEAKEAKTKLQSIGNGKRKGPAFGLARGLLRI